MHRLGPIALAAAAGLVAACQPGQRDDMRAAAPQTPAGAPAAAASTPNLPPAQPNGPPVPTIPLTDASVQAAATVTQVQMVEGQDARVFSTAGGDPAANGLYTHLALFQGPAEPWAVFRLGDFSSWEITEQATGRIVLKVGQDSADPATGDISTTPTRIIVNFTTGPQPVVTVTPAR